MTVSYLPSLAAVSLRVSAWARHQLTWPTSTWRRVWRSVWRMAATSQTHVTQTFALKTASAAMTGAHTHASATQVCLSSSPTLTFSTSPVSLTTFSFLFVGYFGRECVDACQLNPCEHVSSCVRKPSSSHGYTCECGQNYYGQYCENK